MPGFVSGRCCSAASCRVIAGLRPWVIRKVVAGVESCRQAETSQLMCDEVWVPTSLLRRAPAAQYRELRFDAAETQPYRQPRDVFCQQPSVAAQTPSPEAGKALVGSAQRIRERLLDAVIYTRRGGGSVVVEDKSAHPFVQSPNERQPKSVDVAPGPFA